MKTVIYTRKMPLRMQGRSSSSWAAASQFGSRHDQASRVVRPKQAAQYLISAGLLAVMAFETSMQYGLPAASRRGARIAWQCSTIYLQLVSGSLQ
jgi:hypothetical protein